MQPSSIGSTSRLWRGFTYARPPVYSMSATVVSTVPSMTGDSSAVYAGQEVDETQDDDGDDGDDGDGADATDAAHAALTTSSPAARIPFRNIASPMEKEVSYPADRFT